MVAVYVTLGLGAVFDPSLAVRDLLRRRASRKAGQGNSGGKDENSETHGDFPLAIPQERASDQACPLRRELKALHRNANDSLTEARQSIFLKATESRGARPERNAVVLVGQGELYPSGSGRLAIEVRV